MHPQKIQELAARLEQAHDLNQMQRTALLREIERYAAQDLYGAARLCKDHLSKQADVRLPLSVQVAPLLAKHFEMRMNEQRRAVDLYHERDRQLRQPEPNRQYVGPVVGTTPNCVIQLDKDTGDLIVHARTSLVCAFEPKERDKELTIHYPQVAIGGVGLVTRTNDAHSLSNEHAHRFATEHAKPQNAMERSL
jgi:hypothetical protein